MTSSPTRIGLIGCGNISGIYLKNAGIFPEITVTAVADMVPDAAQAKAKQFGIPKACSVAELLADPDIDIVLNLTTPNAHFDVALAALNAGKSVYNEKPLSLTRDQGRQLLELAASKELRVGCAPDTFLGGGLQTCRQLIDEGAIGRPLAATAFMMGRGMETWHPNPDFFYKPGGGPMFDMGPYYLTALITLLGPVARVTGMTAIGHPVRTITSQPRAGAKIAVEVPTHVMGLLQFASGAVGTIITSFDVQASELPRIEIYGSEATLSVPDPNTFGGPVRLRRGGEAAWQEMPLTHGHTENSRGLGLRDMAIARRAGRPHRASGQLAYHVLDLMHAFHDAADQGQHIPIESGKM